MSRWLVLCAILAVSGCATIPSALTQGGPYSTTTPLQAQSGKHEGERVRWGGIIIETLLQAEQTCFEIMALTLDKQAAPQSNDQSLGRFIACAPGYYEPELYKAGRAVTFIGRIHGSEQRKVGEYLYHFSHLVADVVYLWPKAPTVIYVPYPDPFWDPWWPYYYHPYYHRR